MSKQGLARSWYVQSIPVEGIALADSLPYKTATCELLVASPSGICVIVVLNVANRK